jgi:YD repeat-containing protein
MRHFTLLLQGLLIGVLSYGQTVSFTYDNSGNRTSRTTIILKSATGNTVEESSSSAYEDQIGEHSILIYPNPIESEITVKIQGLKEDNAGAINLYDQSGRLVLTLDDIGSNNTLNLSRLSAGNYFMIIQLENDQTKWTIVKE